MLLLLLALEQSDKGGVTVDNPVNNLCVVCIPACLYVYMYVCVYTCAVMIARVYYNGHYILLIIVMTIF